MKSFRSSRPASALSSADRGTFRSQTTPSSHPLLHPNRRARPLAKRRGQAWIGYALILSFYAMLFSFWQAEPVPGATNLLGNAIAALCLFPFGLWVARGNKGVPMFELICVAYLLAFGMPLYLQRNETLAMSHTVYLSWEQTHNTLLVVVAGIASLLVGYYGAQRSGLMKCLPKVDLPLNQKQHIKFFKVILFPSLVLSVLGRLHAFDSLGALSSVASLSLFQLNIAIVLLAYQLYKGQLREKYWAYLLYISVLIAALAGLTTGMLENAMVSPLLVFIVWCHVSRRVPLLLTSFAVIGFIILNSIKHDYRQQAWYGKSGDPNTSSLSLWLNMSQGAVDALLNGDNSQMQETFRSAMSRFDLLHQFVRIHELTPSHIPFYEGRTYSYLWYGWVPRLLWPDKPTAQEASFRASVDYQLITQDQLDDSSVSIGVGHLPEAYINFGFLGVIIIMGIQGIVFASVDYVLNGLYSIGGRAIYLSIMVFFLNGIGTATVAMFYLIVPNVLANGVIIYLFCKRWRAIPSGVSPLSTPARLGAKRSML